MDSEWDVSYVLFLTGRRRVSVLSECNVVAGQAGDMAVYDASEATQWIAVQRCGSWWGPRDVELVTQDPVYYFK